MSQAPALLSEIRGAVGVVQLNRLETRNALSGELAEELAELLEAWEADPAVRAIVIAGGTEVFAAGADVRAMRDSGSQEAHLWPRLAALGTPLIAAVSGYALGGGCELALACDMIVASETAEFGQPEIMLGVIPGGGGTQHLARVVGKQRAMELVLTGKRVSALEAEAMGLVNKVSRKNDWLNEAIGLAEVVASRPPVAVRLGKQAVLAAEESPMSAGLEHERRLHENAMATEDRVEAMTAFLEKRRGEFKGR